MASKRNYYVIATQNGYVGDEFSTKASAVKALAREVRIAAAECRRGKRRCSVIGSAKNGSVEIKIGGRQGYHLWQRYSINQR